jgi:phospholipase D1/2
MGACIVTTTTTKPQPHGHLLPLTSDPYAAVVVAGLHETTVAHTYVFRNLEALRWEARLLLPLAHAATSLEFHVKDADSFGSDLISVASLPAAAVLAAADAPIVSSRGPPKSDGSAIRIFAAAASTSRARRDRGVPTYAARLRRLAVPGRARGGRRGGGRRRRSGPWC